jgi:hypothetical protein
MTSDLSTYTGGDVAWLAAHSTRKRHLTDCSPQSSESMLRTTDTRDCGAIENLRAVSRLIRLGGHGLASVRLSETPDRFSRLNPLGGPGCGR